MKIANANAARLECEVHNQAAYASELERKVERLHQIVEAQKSEIHHLNSVVEHTISEGATLTKEESSDPREQCVNPPADHDSEDGGMMQAAVGVALTAAGAGISIASLFSRH